MSDLRRACTRRTTGGLLAVAALTMAATATAAPASAAQFNCDASALRGTVLSATSIEPVTANRDQPACLTTDGGVGVSLPARLSADAVFARTSAQGAADQQTVSSTGGVEGLRVQSAPLAALNSSFSVLVGVNQVDLRLALQALQARTDLLRATTAVASAGGRCVSGNPLLSGSSQLAGLTVLGQQVSADTANLDVTLDPSDLTDADILAIGQLPDVIRPLLGGLADITVAQVSATIGGQTNVNGKLTQQAARIHVTSAGENVADLVLGEATTTGADVNCTALVEPLVGPLPVDPPAIGQPTVGQPPFLTPQQQQEQLELQRGQALAASALSCTKRRLVLVDVLRQGDRVKLFGAADKRYIGRRVGIVFTATGRTVARPKVLSDGTFAATAVLPSRAIRNTNRARYQAVRGGERSLRLKLARRMVVSSLSSRNGRVTIAGRIIRPLGKPIQTISLRRRVSCTRYVSVKRFKPSRSGRFQVTVRAPKDQTTAVYRLSTRVRSTSRTTKLFSTFTLPRAVNLR